MQIILKSCKNHAKGRQGREPEAIVLQATNQILDSSLADANNPTTKSSFHYIIAADGRIIQLVKDEDTALHCPGVLTPSWRHIKPKLNPNLYTIGIGLETNSNQPITKQALFACAGLIAKLCSKWDIDINPHKIIGVDQINPRLKANNPGASVDFSKLLSLARNNKSTNKPEGEQPPKQAEVPKQNMTEQLQKQVSLLELKCADLESQLKKVSMQKLAHVPEVKSLINQNSRLTEEIYLLQQENRSNRPSTNRSVQRQLGNPAEYLSFRELLVAIVNKIFKPLSR